MAGTPRTASNILALMRQLGQGVINDALIVT